MGPPFSLTSAQWMAVGSAIYNFAAQVYGMASSPNMKQISDSHVAAFSPHPMSIAYFFSPQQLLQLYWLSRFFRSNTKNDQEALKYAPYYVLGNVMIGTWMFFWSSSNFKGADVFVCINSLAQVYYVYTQMPASSPANRATRLVAQTFAGIGVLDFLHNTSVAFFEGVPPNLLTKVATAGFFPLAAFFSQPIMGACLSYCAGALYLGQRNYNVGGSGWTNLLLITAGVSAVAVVARRT